MKRHMIIFFTNETQESMQIIAGLRAKNIEVLIAKDASKLHKFLKLRKVGMILLDDKYISKSTSIIDSFKLLALDSFTNILVIGNAENYDLNKEHSHITYVIDKSWSFHDKLLEIEMYWESELMILEESERTMALRSDNLFLNRLEEDVRIKDRIISGLYLQVLEQKNRFKELHKRWEKLSIDMDSKSMKDFHRILGAEAENKVSWDEYLQHFIEVHPDFFNNLITSSKEELSEENKKMCAYIKMGLNNKEIANIISILPESVKRSQTRIKSKLGVSTNQTLRKFIKTL